MEEAFLPLSVAAEREGLFAYPGLFAAEQDGQVVGFAACTEDELAGCMWIRKKREQELDVRCQSMR